MLAVSVVTSNGPVIALHSRLTSFSMPFLFVFFLFKQNTAYDMHISDWSSDVCSSDLTWLIGQPVFPGSCAKCSSKSPSGDNALISTRPSSSIPPTEATLQMHPQFFCDRRGLIGVPSSR